MTTNGNSERLNEVRESVSSGDISLKDWRVYYSDKFERETTLSDGDIMRVIAWADVSEGDLEPEAWADEMLKEEGRQAITSANQEASAHTLAKDLSKVTEFINAVSEQVIASEKVKMGAVHLMERCPPELLARMPRPNSDTGNNPDVIYIDGQNAKGETTKRKTTYLQVLADDHPKAQEILKKISDIQKDQQRDTPAMAKTDAVGEQAALRGQLNTIRTNYRQMAGLYHLLSDFQACPQLIVGVRKRNVIGDDGKAKEVTVSSAEPIRIVDKNRQEYVAYRAVTAFLRIKLDEIAKKAGGMDKVTYEHVTQAAKRGAGKGKETALTKSNWSGTIIGTFNFLDKDDGQTIWNTTVADAGKGNKEARASVLAAEALYSKLDAMLAPIIPQLRKWKVEQDKETEALKKAEAA